MRRDIFQAIADPTRRALIHRIAQKPITPTALAQNFEFSRQAVSKHIKILTECGVIEMIQHGRERYCVAHMEKLSQVSDWVEQYRSFWNRKLDALDAHLAKDQNPNSTDNPINRTK